MSSGTAALAPTGTVPSEHEPTGAKIWGEQEDGGWREKRCRNTTSFNLFQRTTSLRGCAPGACLPREMCRGDGRNTNAVLRVPLEMWGHDAQPGGEGQTHLDGSEVQGAASTCGCFPLPGSGLSADD